MYDRSQHTRQRATVRGDLGAARIALRGFYQIARANRPIHVQLVAAILVAALVGLRTAIWGPLSLGIIILMAWGHVLSMFAECNNSVKEDIADYLCEMKNGSADFHDELIGRIKDHAAGSVTPIVLFAAFIDLVGLIHG